MSDAGSTLSVVSALPRNYVSRSGWGAKAPLSRPTVLLASRVDTIVYHYTAAGSDERENHAECASRVRGIQSFHQNTRGWNDIAYNYLTASVGGDQQVDTAAAASHIQVRRAPRLHVDVVPWE
jgi:hypothetical protein